MMTSRPKSLNGGVGETLNEKDARGRDKDL